MKQEFGKNSRIQFIAQFMVSTFKFGSTERQKIDVFNLRFVRFFNLNYEN